MKRKFILFFFISNLALAQIHMTNHGGGGNSGSASPASNRGPAAFECPAGGCAGRGASSSHYNHEDNGQYYVPQFVPPPYIPSQDLKDLSAATAYFKKQVQRRNAVRESIKGMDQYEKRHELVEMASESLRVSREHIIADDLQGSNIASEAADLLLDLATSLTPGISWGRDIYEAITGKDLHSGQKLSSFSHGMAILGASTLGLGNKAFKAVDSAKLALKTTGIFEKLALAIPRPARDASEEIIKKFKDSRKLLYEKSITEIKTTIDFFKKYKFYGADTDKMGVSITNAFLKGARIEIVKEPIKVVRYSKDGLEGIWVTTKEVSDPHNSLALMHTYEVHVSHHTIKEGAEILRGTVAPQKKFNEYGKLLYDRPGGAEQILVDTKFLE